MRVRMFTVAVVAGSIGLAPLTGCENLPGGEKEQGAVIGGVGGAVAGAAVAGEDNRLMGALIGGALGAGGGYLIGANLEEKKDRPREEVRDEAATAAQKAQNNPATAEQARAANSADINNDGFVTLDEVVAMEQAEFSDDDMIRRLERSGQQFALTDRQEQYLRDRGVSDRVINAMRDMKPEEIDLRTDPGR